MQWISRNHLSRLRAVLSLSACILLPALAQAEFPKEMDPSLKDAFREIDSLDVEFFTSSPLQDRVTPAEIGHYITRTLDKHPVLPYHSPSDAVMVLSCRGLDCTKILAQITLRSTGGLPNGPVLWEHAVSGFTVPWIPYYKKDENKIGEDIVNALLRDYRLARLEQQPAEPSQSKPVELVPHSEHLINNPQRIEPEREELLPMNDL